MPATAPARLTISQACREIGISRTTFYRQGWDEVFTRFTLPGGRVRVCKLELDEYLQHQDWTRGRAAVRALRKALGRDAAQR